jgi:uncharacterized membrane protein
MPLSGGQARRAKVRESFRSQLWPLPAIGIAVALLLGIALPELDAALDDQLPAFVSDYLFGGGASAARTVLDAIAGSLITVTALTFSLTVVTLQLASSQFSPRLLRTFSSDRFVQLTLALFLGTFTYALTVLRSVRTGDDNGAAFVPQFSVTLAFILTLVSVVALVLFLAHLATEIRVETMLRKVHRDGSRTLRRVLPDRDPQQLPASGFPAARGLQVLLTARSSGFLTHVDEQGLLTAAITAQACVVIDVEPGDSVVAGIPVGTAWPCVGDELSGETLANLQEAVANSIGTGAERTSVQDAAFALRQLTDVAVKALSPGINDPTTAVHALSHSSAVLCELARRDLTPRVLFDERDRPRVLLRRPGLAEFLALAVDQPRRFGAADPAVLGRLCQLLREVGWSADLPADRAAVADQLARLRTTISQQDFDSTELASLAAQTRSVDEALAGSWGAVVDR